jgi:pimeloyl-ACP methyl ester carboxylesterase
MALVKLPAQIPITDPRYGGAVLINPGGPGASGTRLAETAGSSLQGILDAAYAYNSETYVSPHPDARYFDIVGFDPRAVGQSTPYFACPLDPVDVYNLNLQYWAQSLDWEDKSNFDLLYSQNAAWPRGCVWDPAKNPSGSKIANFSSTAMTARDLVEFAERHGQWREKQIANLTNLEQATSQRLRWRHGEEAINYLGYSYGTLLGATLAAMQPHRVSRFLLTGVTQAEEYFQGLTTSDLDDGDRIVNKFFEYCALAGPERCPLWAGNRTSDTAAYFKRIVEDVRSNPIIVAGSADIQANVITVTDINLILSELSSTPLKLFPLIASLIAPLASRNGTAIAEFKQQLINVDVRRLPLSLNPEDPSTATLFTYAGIMDRLSNNVIEGGDTARRYSKAEFVQEFWAPLRKTTKYLADAYATIYLYVAVWPVRPKWTFGDYHAIASNVTANPILFASSGIDGVTSLKSAKFMHSQFKNSGLLISDGEGHTIMSEPSLCVAGAMRFYFQTGRIPDTSKRCLPVERPFLGRNGPNVETLGNLTREDQFLLGKASSAI